MYLDAGISKKPSGLEAIRTEKNKPTEKKSSDRNISMYLSMTITRK